MVMPDTSLLVHGENTLGQFQEAFQTAKFAADGLGWVSLWNGFLLQGGKVLAVGTGATVAVPFITGFEKQVLGIFITPFDVVAKAYAINGVTLAQFNLVNSVGTADYFWFAIGV